MRRELPPEHTGNLLSLEKSLLSQLLDLLAACKKSKQEASTTTQVATTKPTTVLVDTTTTPGEIAYKMYTIIFLDYLWGNLLVLEFGHSGFNKQFTKMLPKFHIHYSGAKMSMIIALSYMLLFVE